MKQPRHYVFNPVTHQTIWVGEVHVLHLLSEKKVEFVHSTVYDGALHNYYNFLETE